MNLQSDSRSGAWSLSKYSILTVVVFLASTHITTSSVATSAYSRVSADSHPHLLP